jgi:S1-C subfamily serine protease
MIRILFSLFLALALVVPGIAEDKLSIVRVNVTTQSWDFLRPWGKRQPVTRRAIGAVLPGPRVLVAGELVANATYLEFETPEGGRKAPASIEAVDYEANLALLKTDDADFLKGVPQLDLTESDIGDQLSIWQLENNGRLLVTNGPMTTAEVSSYPVDGQFLIYRMTAQIQSRDSSFTLPVAKDKKLTGILMSYESQSNNANIIPAPVIQHFLKDAADGKYDGFPRAGYGFSPMRDPALRRYAKVPAENSGGIYITDVLKGGPAETAGLKKGDVLLAADEFAVDQDGNFPDPAYGKIPLGHLISTRHLVGDTVKFRILRDGQEQTLDVKLARRDPASYVSDPYIIDRAPRFYIVGGLMLQELSREWLKGWGNDWPRRAPSRAVYNDRYQHELFKDGPKKLVYLTRVLPTPATVGYEELNSIRVTKINGQDLQNLDDVPKALEKPVNGFHKIEFDDDPKVIYLDANEAEKTDKDVQMQYRLPTMKRLE